MSTTEDKILELREREKREKAQGGPERVDEQHARGKLSARERIDLLVDPQTFNELDMFVRHRCTSFGMDKTFIASEGVITGFGKVNGRLTFVFAQDFTSRGGTVGEMHAKKICKIMDLAMKTGAPVIGLIDSGGARIQEGVDSLAGFGDIFFRNSSASGVIPQITAVMGPAAGGAVYSAAMTDFIIMVKKESYMFVTGPEVVREVTSEDIAFDELGGAMVHNTKSGVAHFACGSDEEAIATVRDLLSYVPQNNRESPPQVASDDDPGRTDPELDTIMPDRFSEVYDVKRVIRSIVDNGKMLESHRYFAPNIITCFARMGGKSVGIMANQPMYLAGCLDVNASDKAARFIRFCDAFNIPFISILDIPGYLPGKDQEWAGIIRHGAKIPWSYAEATIPKIVLITRKTYGGAYIVMCSKQLGFDYILAWPTAEIAVMGAEGATPIIFKKEIGSSDNPQDREKELKEEYRRILYNPYVAASRGYIDAVIEPRMTRPYIMQALEMLSTKRQVRPERKHGNIPL